MPMDRFTTIFLMLLFLATVTELWLSYRHYRYVASHRRNVPSPFRGKITLQAHRKAADYTAARTQLGMIENIYGNLLLLGWTIGGGFQWLDNLWNTTSWPPLAIGTAFIVSVIVIGGILEIPFSIYRTFHIESRFGFNRMTAGVFATDIIRKMILLALIGVPAIAVAIWLMNEAGAYWWFYLWLFWTGLTLFMAWAYPAWIAPMFNRFTPLKAPRLKQRIDALLKRTGFRARGIYVMDSSKRTSHGNAYFTGLGRAKRIVFFDNLLKTLNASEIEAVLAHELGHFKRAHVFKRLIMTFAISFAGLWLLGWLSTQAWFYEGLGVTHPSTYMALILFIMVGPVFMFFLQPLFAWGSRRHEFEADEFAAKTASAKALVSALVKLYRDNAATLTPDPVYSAFYDSHPPAMRRIARLLPKH